MYCILVSGIPASGKTVLAEYLSASLHIPVVSKDKIKEIFYLILLVFAPEQKKLRLEQERWRLCIILQAR